MTLDCGWHGTNNVMEWEWRKIIFHFFGCYSKSYFYAERPLFSEQVTNINRHFGSWTICCSCHVPFSQKFKYSRNVNWPAKPHMCFLHDSHWEGQCVVMWVGGAIGTGSSHPGLWLSIGMFVILNPQVLWSSWCYIKLSSEVYDSFWVQLCTFVHKVKIFGRSSWPVKLCCVCVGCCISYHESAEGTGSWLPQLWYYWNAIVLEWSAWLSSGEVTFGRVQVVPASVNISCLGDSSDLWKMTV